MFGLWCVSEEQSLIISLNSCFLFVYWAEVSSPESLSGRLPLRTLAQVSDVVEGEEEAVPGGGEPGEGEGGIELLEGQFGQLGGACPGRAHAEDHGHTPQSLLHLHRRYSDAAVESPSARARLGSSCSARWLSLRGAHHILPGAFFSYAQTQI